MKAYEPPVFPCHDACRELGLKGFVRLAGWYVNREPVVRRSDWRSTETVLIEPCNHSGHRSWPRGYERLNLISSFKYASSGVINNCTSLFDI